MISIEGKTQKRVEGALRRCIPYLHSFFIPIYSLFTFISPLCYLYYYVVWYLTTSNEDSVSSYPSEP